MTDEKLFVPITLGTPRKERASESVALPRVVSEGKTLPFTIDETLGKLLRVVKTTATLILDE